MTISIESTQAFAWQPENRLAPLPAAAAGASNGAPMRAPRTVQETGLSFLMLVQLLAKLLFMRGRLTLPQIVSHIKLPLAVVNEVLGFMRREHLCEMVRRGERDSDIEYELSGTGKSRAADYLTRCQYAGPAPVTLESYTAQVARQSVSGLSLTRQEVHRAFKDIIVPAAVLDKLGTAVNSGRPILIHGPAGSGKSYLAECLQGLLKDNILVPHALVVDEEIVQVYDPLIHHTVEANAHGAPETDSTVGHGSIPLNRGRGAPDSSQSRDKRWVLCKRPIAISGGELSLPMLDLCFDETARFYQAPPHVKANNGIYIIDDLGRQLVSAHALMNRLIVPLDRARDYLSLHTGSKFVVPLDAVMVFSTNLNPVELADESFLRRLSNKIYVGPVDEPTYRRIFEHYCGQFGIPFYEAAFEHLLHDYHRKHGRPLLACNPRDLLGLVRDFSRYEGRPPELTEERIAQAWTTYFVTAQ